MHAVGASRKTKMPNACAKRDHGACFREEWTIDRGRQPRGEIAGIPHPSPYIRRGNPKNDFNLSRRNCIPRISPVRATTSNNIAAVVLCSVFREVF